MGDTGIEPVTSSVSRKRATTAPIARVGVLLEVETGFEPVYAALQAAASPLGHSTVGGGYTLRADDRARTGDLNLGKVALYQLSYIRARHQAILRHPLAACCETVADPRGVLQTEHGPSGRASRGSESALERARRSSLAPPEAAVLAIGVSGWLAASRRLRRPRVSSSTIA